MKNMLNVKLLIFFLLFFCISLVLAFGQNSDEEKLKACGTKKVNYKASTEKKQRSMPDAPVDKALIYVLRTTILGMKIHSKLAVDGEWKGVNRGKTYFFFTVEPGERYFCSESENQDYLKLNVEAGKTYFLKQEVKFGTWKARTKLVQMTEEEGRESLKKLNLSVFEEKSN
jgi:hypothetical protein